MGVDIVGVGKADHVCGGQRRALVLSVVDAFVWLRHQLGHVRAHALHDVHRTVGEASVVTRRSMSGCVRAATDARVSPMLRAPLNATVMPETFKTDPRFCS